MVDDGGMPSSEERKFLHDLSTPLATAIIMLDSAMEELNARPLATEDLSHLTLVFESLLAMKQLVASRRDVLHGRTDP